MFNLKKAKKARRPIDVLREIDPDLRYGDLDLEDTEIEMLSNMFQTTKTAVHGRGDNWTEVDRYNPYNTSPLVKFVPEFGGRWRRNFPGSGDQHINDDSDKEKSYKSTGDPNDFDPKLKEKLINDHTDESSYRVKVELDPEDFGSQKRALELLGDKGEFDGDCMFVEVSDFQAAIQLERELREKGLKVILEPSI